MRTYPVVLKELQMEQGIEGDITFGKGMRLASEGIEPIAESTIGPLNMDGSGLGDDLAQGGTDLNGEQFPMLITMLDGLRQAHIWRDDQWGPTQLPRA